jgi:hypothetical protein
MEALHLLKDRALRLRSVADMRSKLLEVLADALLVELARERDHLGLEVSKLLLYGLQLGTELLHAVEEVLGPRGVSRCLEQLVVLVERCSDLVPALAERCEPRLGRRLLRFELLRQPIEVVDDELRRCEDLVDPPPGLVVDPTGLDVRHRAQQLPPAVAARADVVDAF